MNFPPALSSSESGWLKAHAKDFHNLFGAAHGGDPIFVYRATLKVRLSDRDGVTLFRLIVVSKRYVWV